VVSGVRGKPRWCPQSYNESGTPATALFNRPALDLARKMFTIRSHSCSSVSPINPTARVPAVDRRALFQRRTPPSRRERRGGRCPLCGHPHRASGLQGGVHAISQSSGDAVPARADSGAERPRSLNRSRYLVPRVIEMPAKRPQKAHESRTWRVSVFKKRLQYVGRVRAPDKESAAGVAAAEFRLRDHELTRLLIEEVSL